MKSREGDGGCNGRTLVSSENCSQAIVICVVIWMGCSEGVFGDGDAARFGVALLLRLNFWETAV